MTRPAVFLDRDGVLNEARRGGYVLSRNAFHWLPGAKGALAILAKNFGGEIVVVTNQSPIGRGLVSGRQVGALHAWMVGQIEEAGGRVDAVYVCPHAPEESCRCRKPAPGLFLDAARELDLDLAESFMVGDTLADMQAAWSAGIRRCYRVRCGLPFEDPLRAVDTYTVVGTLSEAVAAILGKEQTDATVQPGV